MRVITAKHIKAFGETHADAKGALSTWLEEVEGAQWRTPHDVQAMFPYVSILGNNRLCFNIRGNTYRLIVAVLYSRGIVMVKFIGTHRQYDDIEAETVDDFA